MFVDTPPAPIVRPAHKAISETNPHTLVMYIGDKPPFDLSKCHVGYGHITKYGKSIGVKAIRLYVCND